MLHMLKNDGVLIMVTDKVLVLSLSQEHFQRSVYVGDPSSSLDTAGVADVHSKFLSESIELSFQLATEVVGFPN